MKKQNKLSYLCFLLCILLVMSSLVGCETPVSVEVTYVLSNGQENITETVTTMFGITKAPIPRRTNYIFSGWYQNEECTVPYDIKNAPKRDMTLYAGWIFDYERYINKADKILASTVEVTAELFSNSYYGSQTLARQSGSGVIVYESDLCYYVVTNNHVTYFSGQGNKDYSVKDIYERTYSATLLDASAEYDLALLSIRKIRDDETPLSVAEFADKNPPVSTICCAIGSPGGVRNRVTFGQILDLAAVDLENTGAKVSDVEFPVFSHDAPMDNGSSGGPIFDSNYELIGINYAAETAYDNFMEGFAIPVEKVRIFLNMSKIGKEFS